MAEGRNVSTVSNDKSKESIDIETLSKARKASVISNSFSAPGLDSESPSYGSYYFRELGLRGIEFALAKDHPFIICLVDTG